MGDARSQSRSLTVSVRHRGTGCCSLGSPAGRVRLQVLADAHHARWTPHRIAKGLPRHFFVDQSWIGELDVLAADREAGTPPQEPEPTEERSPMLDSEETLYSATNRTSCRAATAD